MRYTADKSDRILEHLVEIHDRLKAVERTMQAMRAQMEQRASYAARGHQPSVGEQMARALQGWQRQQWHRMAGGNSADAGDISGVVSQAIGATLQKSLAHWLKRGPL